MRNKRLVKYWCISWVRPRIGDQKGMAQDNTRKVISQWVNPLVELVIGVTLHIKTTLSKRTKVISHFKPFCCIYPFMLLWEHMRLHISCTLSLLESHFQHSTIIFYFLLPLCLYVIRLVCVSLISCLNQYEELGKLHTM